MARLQILNKVNNAHLLSKYGISGITVEDSKVTRYICSCGEVLSSPNCKNCENQNFEIVRFSGWHSSTGVIKMGDLHSPSKNVIERKKLTVTVDTHANIFNIVEVSEPFAEFHDNKLEVKVYRNDQELMYEFIKNNPSSFDEEIFTNFFKYDKFCRETGFENYLYEGMYNFFNHTNIPRTEILEYKKLVEALISGNNNLSLVMKSSVAIISIKQVISILELPLEFCDYYKIKGYPSYHYSRIEKCKKCIPLIMNIFKHSLLHSQLSFSEIMSIACDVSELDEVSQEEFADFFIKHVNFFKGKCFDRYKEMRDIKAKYFPINEPINLKRCSKMLIHEHLTKKKVNGIRVNAIIDVMDKDPMLALDLMSQNKALTPEEMAIVQKASM